jgi:hypothetical protein
MVETKNNPVDKPIQSPYKPRSYSNAATIPRGIPTR